MFNLSSSLETLTDLLPGYSVQRKPYDTFQVIGNRLHSYHRIVSSIWRFSGIVYTRKEYSRKIEFSYEPLEESRLRR